MIAPPESITVPAIGPADAIIACVGEAGGEQEAENREPFWPDAPTGGLLMDMAAAAGLARTELYLTNLVKRQPYANNISPYFSNGGLTPKGRAWQEYLLAELRELDTEVIVAVGKPATVALTGDQRSIYLLRGSPIVTPLLPGKVVIPTLHPSGIIRTGQFNARYLLAADLRNARDIARAGGVEALPQRELIVDPTFQEAKTFLHRLQGAPEFAFDIETSGSAVTCIAFSLSPLEAMSIPVSKYGAKEATVLWELIRDVLEDPDSEKITQNGNYDTFFLHWNYGIDVPLDTLHDTMVAHSIMYPQLLSASAKDAATGKSLATLCSLWAWEPYYKDEADKAQGAGDFTAYQLYNAKDAAITHHVWTRIRPLLEADDGFLWTYDFTMARFPALHEMQRNGFIQDSAAFRKERETLVREMAELEAKLDALTRPMLAKHLDPMLATLQEMEAQRAELKEKAKACTAGKKGADAETQSQLETQRQAHLSAAKALSPKITQLRTQLRQWCRANAAGKPIEWEWQMPWSAGQAEKACIYFNDWLGEPEHKVLRKGPNGKTTSRSMDDDALKKLAKPLERRPAYEEAILIQHLRERAKIVETYIDGCVLMPGKRIRAMFNPRGTWTGRYSSSKMFFKYGVQLQNVPPRIRRSFLPDEPEYEEAA